MGKDNHAGKRSRREDARKRIPYLGYYCIVTDTKKTEENFFTGLKESLPDDIQGRLVIKVIKTETANLIDACRRIVAKDPQYREPWIIFDRDAVNDFDRIVKDAHSSSINVGWSNPCIEIWFGAYFGKMPQYETSVDCCHGFSETFRKKTGVEYDKADRKIYGMLAQYGDEQKAIDLAAQRFHHYSLQGRKQSEMHSCTSIHMLIDEIRKKSGTSG